MGSLKAERFGEGSMSNDGKQLQQPHGIPNNNQVLVLLVVGNNTSNQVRNRWQQMEDNRHKQHLSTSLVVASVVENKRILSSQDKPR